MRSQPDVGPAVLEHLSANLRRLRTDGKMSQGELAASAGLSRRMIAAIENGAVNVSLTTVDRLAAALGATFTQMVRAPSARDGAQIEALAWQGKSPESEAVLLGAAPASREAELWLWSLGPGETYNSEEGSEHWHEVLFVIRGELTLARGTNVHVIKPFGFQIFSSGDPYQFQNNGKELLQFIRSVVL
jgi:transcriptional regulator with XRE-family HTH domain